MIPIGSLDRITAIIGERGTGKSTLAKYDALGFQSATGGFVIGHSPNGQIGQERYIQFHDSLASLEKGLRRKPELMHLLASGGTPEDVQDYSRRLSLALREQAHKRAGVKFNPHRPAPRGLLAPPVHVIVDEGTHSQQVKTKEELKAAVARMSTSEKEELERFLTSTRHEHISLTWLIQAPTARSWIYQEQANRFRIFRYMHEWGLNAVRAAAIPKEALPTIRELPDFHYFHLDKEAQSEAGLRVLPEP